LIESEIENPDDVASDNLWAWSLEGKRIATVIAGGILDPDGSFRIVLPQTVPADRLHLFQKLCRRGLTLSDPEAGGLLVPLLADVFGTQVLHTTSSYILTSPNEGDRASVRIYVDRDTTVTGSCTRGEYRGLSAGLNLKEGWNLAVLEVAGTGLFSPRSEVRSEPLPEGARWYAFPDTRE
jgi:hypothetical protein